MFKIALVMCSFIYLLLFNGCINNPNDITAQQKEEEKHTVLKTNDYAVYPFSLTEDNATEINEYVNYERFINIQFPQIYYSNEYEGYDEELETMINSTLFSLSMRNDNSIIMERYNRELKEYCMNYIITKSEGDTISIKYTGHLYSVFHAQDFCFGITFNYKTGEIAKVTDYITINDKLLEYINEENIDYYSSSDYDKDIIINGISDFINDYNQNLIDLNNCFYIKEDEINLIIPVKQGNSNYFIIKI